MFFYKVLKIFSRWKGHILETSHVTPVFLWGRWWRLAGFRLCIERILHKLNEVWFLAKQNKTFDTLVCQKLFLDHQRIDQSQFLINQNLKRLHWGFLTCRNWEHFPRNWCTIWWMSGLITCMHICSPFPHSVFQESIFIAQNDQKMKSVATIFTQIQLRIAQKINFQFNSWYFFTLSFQDCLPF
jgi:hypothetical protein